MCRAPSGPAAAPMPGGPPARAARQPARHMARARGGKAHATARALDSHTRPMCARDTPHIVEPRSALESRRRSVAHRDLPRSRSHEISTAAISIAFATHSSRSRSSKASNSEPTPPPGIGTRGSTLHSERVDAGMPAASNCERKQTARAHTAAQKARTSCARAREEAYPLTERVLRDGSLQPIHPLRQPLKR